MLQRQRRRSPQQLISHKQKITKRMPLLKKKRKKMRPQRMTGYQLGKVSLSRPVTTSSTFSDSQTPLEARCVTKSR